LGGGRYRLLPNHPPTSTECHVLVEGIFMSTARRIAGLPAGRRSKYVVLALWFIAIAVAGPLAGKLTGVQKNDSSAWLPGSAESTKVLDQSGEFQPKDVFTAVVVYERTSGVTEADNATVAEDITKLSGLEGATKIVGPFTSDDKQALEILVPLNLGPDGWNKASDAVDEMKAITADGANGLNVAITGPLGFAADSVGAFKGLDGVLLFGTILVVIALLLITYRSPILWILPVMSAGIALTTAQGLIYLLAKAGLTVNGQSAGILTVLVFGAGTDYALLIIARYREELRRHTDRHEAMREALHRAGPAIFASAATVAIGMLTLSVAQMNSTKSLGPVLAIGIAVALLAMTTLLPAILVTCGRWVFWPAKPKHGSAEPNENGVWARVGTRISRRPRLVWVATAVILGALALGATDLNAGGLTNAESFTKDVPSVTGEEVAAKHFAAGAGNPVVVIGNASAAAQIRQTLSGVSGVSAVTEPVVKGNLVYLEGTLTDAPDSPAGYATVDRARAALHGVPGAEAKVGGGSAIALDIARATRHDRNVIIPIVLIVVLIILGLLLRALIAPVLLVATVVLSFGAALGISALAFKHIFGWENADTSFPLFLFVFLVALGIDYNIFLMTRVREEALRYGTRRGALIGLAATGAVITSAGAVLAATFAVLGTLPLVSFAELGFAVAVGVLLDTIVVRSVLVTALNLDIGRKIWWPSKLADKEDVRPTSTGAVEGEPALVD
jgi:RND superfamily putative drug exporter